jgi:hypothetical protein
MRIERTRSGGFVLHASQAELLLINNALNEVCHALPLDHFETRVGVPLAEAESLLRLVNATLNKYQAH